MTFTRLRDVLTVLALGLLVGACETVGEPRDPLGTGEGRSSLGELGYARVSLKSFGYWGGSFEWEAPPEGLSAAQREALEGLEVIRGNADCLQDIQEYALTLVDTEGQERQLFTNAQNAGCGKEQLLDFATLQPLLDTLQCVGTGKAAPQLSAAETIHAGDGCRHGFFAYKDEPPRWVKVAPAAEGGPHTFALRHCGGKTTALELFDDTGTTRLAQSEADGRSSTDCPALSVPLEPGKRYALRVTSQAVSVGGHVLLEVRPEE